MPDELDDEIDPLDQDDNAPADAPDTDELPDDPELLKTRLRETELEARRSVKAAQREAERQRELATEQKAKADYWSRAANQNLPPPTAAPKTTAAKTSDVTDIEALTEDLDMADFVGDEKGAGKFIKEIVSRVVEPLVNRKLDERVSQEQTRTSEATREYQTLAAQYPDLANADSQLSREAYAELELVAKEKPHWKEHEQFAEATRRAAQTLGIQPGTKTQPTTASTSRDRLRTAQGGPAPRGGQPGGRPAVVTPELARMATKTAGGQLSPEALARVAKTVQAAQRQSQRR